MVEKEPANERLYLTQDATPASWAEARGRLADADLNWLATVRPDGLPHLVPILAVWVDGALHFVASPTFRKARNLARRTLHHHGKEGRSRSGGRRHSCEGERRNQAPSRGRGVMGQVRMAGDRARRRLLRRWRTDCGSAPVRSLRGNSHDGLRIPTDETFSPTRWRF
jgi:hypothetical protein